MNIFYGILGLALSYSLIKYRYSIYKTMGEWSFAEKIFGSGGTITAIVLMAFLIIIVSFMIMFGQFDTAFSGVSKYTKGDSQ